MIHPNSMAEEYIWDEFQDAFFSSETKELLHHIHQIHKNLNHIPFNPYSQAHHRFLSKLKELITLMPSSLDFTGENHNINDQLKQIENHIN